MTYTVHPVTLFALMRDGQDTPVAIYHTAPEAQAAAEMLAKHKARTAGNPHPFSELALAN